MQLGRMAIRNLLRNRRRSLITIFSVGFGLLLAVFFIGSADYSYTNMINTSASLGLGHLAIEPAGYNDSPSLTKRLADARDLRNQAMAVEGVVAAYSRISGQAMFAAGAQNTGGSFLAIDPRVETPAHNLFLEAIEQGKLFADADGNGAVVGAKVAEKLKLALGRKLIYTLTDAHGEITSQIARVSGIFRTGDDAVDGSVILLPIDRVRKTLRYGENEASMVVIYIDDQRQAEAVGARLRERLGGGDREVLTWKDTQADLAGLIAIDRFFNYAMQILVGLLIAAGILNTLLMSVLERTREFGMMLALGMSPRQVVALVLLESFWIGLCGLLLGLVMTVPLYWYMSRVGIDLSGLIGNSYSAGGVLVDPVMKIRLFAGSVAGILTGAVTLTLLAGLYPAARAGRLVPVESLKRV